MLSHSDSAPLAESARFALPSTTRRVGVGYCPQHEDFPGMWRPLCSAQATLAWEVHESQICIEAPGNCFAFLEREAPAWLTGVRCAIRPESDQGSAWGPGVALLWPNGGIRANVRRDGRFGVDFRGSSIYGGSLRPDAWNFVQIRLEGKDILVETSYEGKLWALFGSYSRQSLQGPPAAVRVGKMSRHGQQEDFVAPGRPGSCSISGLMLLGNRE